MNGFHPLAEDGDLAQFIFGYESHRLGYVSEQDGDVKNSLMIADKTDIVRGGKVFFAGDPDGGKGGGDGSSAPKTSKTHDQPSVPLMGHDHPQQQVQGQNAYSKDYEYDVKQKPENGENQILTPPNNSASPILHRWNRDR